MFSLPQVISMALIEAAKNGNVQACWDACRVCSMLCIRPNPPISIIPFAHSISFHQPQLPNTTRLTLPRPAPNTHKQTSSVFRLIALHTHTHSLTHSHTHTRTHTRTRTHTHTNTSHSHTHLRSHTHTHSHTHSRTHIHTDTRVCAYTHTHSLSHTHTHTHTHAITLALALTHYTP